MQGTTGYFIFGNRRRTISIHAPMQGATGEYVPGVGIVIFQSTHPCRVRHIALLLSVPISFISIHAPMQGATDDEVFAYLNLEISIHAPMQGATTDYIDMLPNDEFQSTHPCRVRQNQSLTIFA